MNTKRYTSTKKKSWRICRKGKTTNIMKGKRRFGMGCGGSVLKRKKKRTTPKRMRKIAFGSGIVHKVRHALRQMGNRGTLTRNLGETTLKAVGAAKKFVRMAGGRRNIRTPRIIPIPKVGGILPLIPIFAGLSALGSLAAGSASVVRAINSAKESKEKLAEANRHNTHMEAIALGKMGKGVYLKPYRKGLGIYLKSQTPKN